VDPVDYQLKAFHFCRAALELMVPKIVPQVSVATLMALFGLVSDSNVGDRCVAAM